MRQLALVVVWLSFTGLLFLAVDLYT